LLRRAVAVLVVIGIVLTSMEHGKQPPAQESDTNSPPGIFTVTEKKRKHKETEQRGRDKINQQILQLKSLLPECKYVMTTKASVLECTVSSLKRLQTLCSQLMFSNKRLQKENRALRSELERIIAETGVSLNIHLDPEDDDQLIFNSEFTGEENDSGLLPSGNNNQPNSTSNTQSPPHHHHQQQQLHNSQHQNLPNLANMMNHPLSSFVSLPPQFRQLQQQPQPQQQQQLPPPHITNSGYPVHPNPPSLS